jgi:hypothetical protein
MILTPLCQILHTFTDCTIDYEAAKTAVAQLKPGQKEGIILVLRLITPEKFFSPIFLVYLQQYYTRYCC